MRFTTHLYPDTVRRRLQTGMGNTPLGNGCKPLLPSLIEQALVDAMSSYINLACVEMEKQPQQKHMIAKLSSCLKGGPMLLQDYKVLYKRLYKGFATNVKIISGGSNIEERRVMWTTYNNINMWFGFARVKLGTEPGEGELVFFPNQLNCILNLDESGLSLDGNHSLCSGRSSTRFGSANKLIPSGCDRTNKSSCRITFIGGNTAAGHALPPHFHLKSVDDDDNKRIQQSFLNGIPEVYGIYGSNRLVCNGITVNCNQTAGLDTVEF